MDAQSPTIDELMATLRQRGQRATTSRRAVLSQLLAARDEHLSAEDLARRVAAEYPEIHLSTIYRALDSLDAAGLVAPSLFHDHAVTYHLADDHHHHAVCDRCGEVINIDASMFTPLSNQLMDQHQFAANPYHITIRGTCSGCQTETND